MPHLKSATITKTLRVLEGRLGVSQSRISDDIRVAHEVNVLADSLRALAADIMDCVIIFGASAVTDRQDVIPAAIESAGGTVAHVGMPVDPGNLLVLGTVRGVPVIGAPGCARSARENGFDWVLNRLIADLPVTARDIMRMGVGGLLKGNWHTPAATRRRARIMPGQIVPAIVLAAGRSSRMGAIRINYCCHLADSPLSAARS